MANIKYIDSGERKKISEELDKCFFVEAGAGSGKTHSLVDRMVGLIRYGHAKIENIAAVTFTRKAAAELRERVQIKLEDLLHTEGVSEAEKDNMALALSTFERSFISTIHSFCARLLRERPVEAGIDPGFEEVEEEEDTMLAEEAWAEYIEKQGFENNKIIGWMRENGIGQDALNNIYLTLVRYSDVETAREDLPRPDFKKEKKEVKELIYSLRKKMPAERPESGWDSLQKAVLKCLRLFSLNYLDEDRLFVRVLKILSKNTTVTQNRWPNKDGKDHESAMTGFQERVAVPALKAWGEYLHKPLIDFALDGVRYYDNWRRERSLLNFQDLLMRTAKLLRENAEVRAYFKKKIIYLLVDEFQDTDPIQAEIVMLITGADNSVNDWRKVVPRKGALFLVGDPKQSIYRFRRADIDIFNQVKGIFKKGAGEVLELTSNFRSLDPVRDLTNAVFNDVFPAEETVYQAKYAPLATTRGKNDKFDNGIFEISIGKVDKNRSHLAAEIDARIIASWIYASINGEMRLERTDGEKAAGKTADAEPGDFMIITKLKKRLPVYARALEILGIPYEISGGENFNQSEELYEIYKVLKAVADPKDPCALIAALRGAFFGVSDNDLYLYVRAGGKFSYFSDPSKGPGNIKKAFGRLKEFNDIVSGHAPATAVEMIIEKLGVIPLAISEMIGATRAGNILKAIELLREKRSGSVGSFANLVERLKEMRDIKGIEEMTLFPGTTRAVRIMNLHKAKGLEAPVVILADPLGVSGDYEPLLHVKRTKTGSIGYFGISQTIGEFSNELLAMPGKWDECVKEEGEYELAESKRLDYVAVTRAKNILAVSTYHDGRRKKAWELLYGYLGDMPKLSVKKFATPRKRQSITVSAQDWTKEKEKMEKGLLKVTEPSYRHTSVTAIVESPEIFTGGGKDGMAWGSIVHKALEMCGKGKREKLETLARNWIVEEERPLGDVKRLLHLVDGIMKSEMWGRMLKSEERYFELPFSALESGDTVIRGVMDVMFKEKDGWVVVDYKTDDFDKYPDRKKAYQNQLRMYAELWEKMTGDKVKERLLCKV